MIIIMAGYRRQIIITFYGTALLTKIDISVEFKELKHNIRVTHNNSMLVYNIIQLIPLLLSPLKHCVLSIKFHS